MRSETGAWLTSVNDHVHWLDALRLIGIIETPTALPVLVDCPFCSGLITVMSDAAANGQWFWCRSCGFAGDSIEVVAAALEITPKAAIALLVANDIIVAWPQAAIDNYLELNINRRKRLESLFAAAADAFPTTRTDPAGGLRDHLGFRGRSQTPEEWRTRGGQCVGLVNVADLAAWGVVKKRRVTGKGRGGPWRESAIIPTWDLPGRISGYFLFGRNFHRINDVREHRLFRADELRKGTDGRVNAEGGVAALPTALGPPTVEFGDAVFVLDHPVDAVKLHLRWFGDHADALPVIAHHRDGDHAPARVWEALSPRPVVLITDVADHKTLRIARDSGGVVFEAGSRKRLNQLLAEDPAVVLKHAINEAADWRSALDAAMSRLPIGEADELLRRCGVRRHEAIVMSRGSKTMSKRLLGLFVESKTVKHAPSIRNEAYMELGGGWSIRRAGGRVDPFTDYVLRLDALGRGENTGEVIAYKGRFIIRDEEHPFEISAIDATRPGRQNWIRVTATKLGSTTHRSDPSRVLEAAFLFSKPKDETIWTTVGWSDAASAFVFPKFRIAANGDVVPNAFNLETINEQVEFRELGDWVDPPDHFETTEPTLDAVKKMAAVLVAAAIHDPRRQSSTSCLGGDQQHGRSLSWYLRDLASRRFKLPPGDDLRRRVNDDVDAWASRQTGEAG